MIRAGDKLIIIAEALEDERNGVVYVKLTSDSQSHMTMLTENCKKAPKSKEVHKLEKIEQTIDDCDSGMISCEQLFLNLRTILEQE